MSPVYKLSANSVRNGRTVYGSMLAGNTTYVPAAFESIATVTVGSGGVSSVTFSSIPSSYTHLQLRLIARGHTSLERVAINFNNDTNGANYSVHYLYGNGSSASAGGVGNQVTELTTIPSSTQTASAFGACVVDILDFANTNKYKTVRSLGGSDLNGAGGFSIMYSGVWRNTAAVNRIDIVAGTVGSGNIAQYSHFALYGIKGA